MDEFKNVTPEYIKNQRESGWPDIHPEDFCHRCGNRNPKWYVDQVVWDEVTEAWAAETGREGICCPTCFIEMSETVGLVGSWKLVPGVHVRRIETTGSNND